MPLLDRLSPDAQQQAAFIRDLLKFDDTESMNALLKDLLKEYDVLSYATLTNVSVARHFYELNRMVRKRNAIFARIKDFQEKYSVSNAIFQQFLISGSEIIQEVNNFQAALTNLQRLYRKDKYDSKECSALQTSIARQLERVKDSQVHLEEIREFFFEKTT